MTPEARTRLKADAETPNVAPLLDGQRFDPFAEAERVLTEARAKESAPTDSRR